MIFSVEDLIKKYNYSKEKAKYFSNFEIVEVLYKRANNFAYIRAKNDFVLPYSLYNDLVNYFKELSLDDFKIFVEANNQALAIKEINLYLKQFETNNGCFKEAVPLAKENGFILSYNDQNAYNSDLEYLDELKLFFYDLGYRKDIEIKMQDFKKEVIIEKEPLIENKVEKPSFEKTEYKNNYQKTKKYNELKIDDLVDTMFGVKFKGEIFKVEEKITRNNNMIQTVYVKDEDNAVIVKFVEGRKYTRALLKENKVGKCAYFYGNYRYDSFLNDYIFEPDQIEFIDNYNVLKDDADKKRIELHCHTKLSEMDGVSSPSEVVKAAFDMGHKAIAITDHLCLQGFHEAQMQYLDIKKKHPDADFKVIYGCEMNAVSPALNIVYNSNDNELREQEYVVFDLETTGLSCEYDHVIEFGAVLMYKGTVLETKDILIKPPVSLSEFTKNLTHISEKDLLNAPSFKEAVDEILAFIKDRVLVAHNASFDFGFLNAELERINRSTLSNTVIDTLDLSRSMFKARRAYRLGNMCRVYNVNYDEEVAHRADYDANVLSQVFNLMLKDLAKNNVCTLNDLKNYQSEDAFVKNRAYHINVLCKNPKGLKALYKLVSISNTDTLAVFGKANTKDPNSDFIVEPRIFKETILEYRDDLLLGSACFNGEVFEIASTKSKKDLANIISFFDFIEIQPLENYRFLYEDRQSFTLERCQEYLKDIISEALRQNKIVVATGDVHFIRKDEKILRDVYINAQAIGGAHHPLFLFDSAKRQKQVTPDQRFLNTKEMMDAFSWLEDPDLIYKLVVENPNKIADMCEEYKPFGNELKPPKIDDAIATARKCNIYEEPFINDDRIISADDYLRELVYYAAKKLYGDNYDSIISNRIDTELNAIIGNGYGVIYFVCHLMVKRSNDDGYIVGSRGSVGSSLVATLSGITEVNPLAPHYVCPNCHKLIWVKDIASGYDLKDKNCPDCNTKMIGDGQNIPFETFLGFHGEKIPDIDLNFSGDYQPKAHLFTREIFGDKNVFRAGTISTVAEKTAFGYVSGYCEEKNIMNMSHGQRQRLASGCEGVKRTTGQHAGGIVVLPDDMEIEDVTPIQFPANDLNAAWKSTHFEYHDFSDILLKFDILGHVDPTAMRLFENISGINVQDIPMNDEKVLSLFYSTDALNIINPNYHEVTGACGLPEFGTLNTRNTIVQTKPHVFSELVQISGLSHGTDVWRGNAEELIKSGIKLADVIGCRDDIMSTLILYNLESKDAFSIMEKVRKGKGLTPDEEKLMLEHDVPKWYVESCKKIKYMFPKAHAVAYCIMAVRVAWFKVYYPEYFYVSYFTLRCDAYEIETMIKDADSIKARMDELTLKIYSRENPASKKEKDLYDTLEVCYEMVSRGYQLTNIDLYKSLATEFLVNPLNNHEIIPPFVILDGLGENVAESIISAREERAFLSKEDLIQRTQLSNTLVKKLNDLGVLEDLDDSNQISLF